MMVKCMSVMLFLFLSRPCQAGQSLNIGIQIYIFLTCKIYESNENKVFFILNLKLNMQSGTLWKGTQNRLLSYEIGHPLFIVMAALFNYNECGL